MPAAQTKVTRSCKPGAQTGEAHEETTTQRSDGAAGKYCLGTAWTEAAWPGCRERGRKPLQGSGRSCGERTRGQRAAEGGRLCREAQREALIRERQGDCEGAEEISYLVRCY